MGQAHMFCVLAYEEENYQIRAWEGASDQLSIWNLVVHVITPCVEQLVHKIHNNDVLA